MTAREERDRENGFRGHHDRARHVVSIYNYRPEKQWRTTIRGCASETAAEARWRTMRWARTPREVHFLCRRLRRRRRCHWLTNKTRRRYTPFRRCYSEIPSLFYSNKATHKRTPICYMFFKRFRIIFFSLSYSPWVLFVILFIHIGIFIVCGFFLCEHTGQFWLVRSMYM